MVISISIRSDTRWKRVSFLEFSMWAKIVIFSNKTTPFHLLEGMKMWYFEMAISYDLQ